MRNKVRRPHSCDPECYLCTIVRGASLDEIEKALHGMPNYQKLKKQARNIKLPRLYTEEDRDGVVT